MRVVNALGKNDIEEEKKAAKKGADGYDQLIDENGDSVHSQADEENLLVLDEVIDDTLFRDLSENDPLLIERRGLVTAKKDLDNYLKKRHGSKAKITPQEEAMKASLQKRL